MKNFLCLAAVLAARSSAVIAQDPPSRPKFELASVKECNPMDRPPPATSSPGRLSLGCWQLKRLIQDAYEVFADGRVDPLNPATPVAPVEGDPSWIRSASYSIDAKSENPQSPAMMRGPMMQALLEDRFHLQTHRETREVPAYIMTVAKGGPKLQPAKDGSCTDLDFSRLDNRPSEKPWCAIPRTGRNGPISIIDVRGVTIDVFAKLIHPGGRPVIDRTGLTGTFDIHLELPPDMPSSLSPDGGASDPPGMSFVAAMREQLGLRLTSGKGAREFLVIDRVERPSGN